MSATICRFLGIVLILGFLLGTAGVLFCNEMSAYLQAESRRQELLSIVENLKSRTLTKTRVATALREGRITLPYAAICVRAIDEPHPFWDLLVATQPGDSLEERLCRHVIARTVDLVENNPDEAAALEQRLEKELESARDSLGHIELPRLPPARRFLPESLEERSAKAPRGQIPKYEAVAFP